MAGQINKLGNFSAIDPLLDKQIQQIVDFLKTLTRVDTTTGKIFSIGTAQDENGNQAIVLEELKL